MFHKLNAVTLTYSTLKIIGIATVSRADHPIAQTRELECTKVVVPQVVNRGRLVILCCVCMCMFNLLIHRPNCCQGGS